MMRSDMYIIPWKHTHLREACDDPFPLSFCSFDNFIRSKGFILEAEDDKGIRAGLGVGSTSSDSMICSEGDRTFALSFGVFMQRSLTMTGSDVSVSVLATLELRVRLDVCHGGGAALDFLAGSWYRDVGFVDFDAE